MSFKFLKNFVKYGIALPTIATYAGAYYYFEDLRDNQLQILQAMQRYGRVAIAGLKMTYVYKYDQGDLSDKHNKAALILRKAFIDNAGLFIKFGQLVASLDVIVPPEYRFHFEQLCHDCPESSFEDVKQNIEKQFKKPLDEMFTSFEKKPIKSASIGQVHKAVLREGNQKVAVKIQHNWLKEQSPSDLKMIELFVDIGEKIFPEFQFKWFSEEVNKILEKELDFYREVRNAEKCRQQLKNLKNIRIPKNYLKLCNDKVIIMEWVDGIPIMDVETLKKSTLNLKDISNIISKAFCQMIYLDGFVHADPHQGNFIIRHKDNDPKKETEVVLIDHGLYLDLDQNVKLNYSKLWKGIITQDEHLMQDACKMLGGDFNFQLFISMITSRKYSDIMNEEKDMKIRLVSPDDAEHRKELALESAKFHKQIIQILHEMNRSLILLLKITDFLRTIDNKLGTPINTFKITLDYCYKGIEEYEKQNNINRGIFESIQYKLVKILAETKLNIAKLLIQLKIMNPI